MVGSIIEIKELRLEERWTRSMNWRELTRLMMSAMRIPKNERCAHPDTLASPIPHNQRSAHPSTQ